MTGATILGIGSGMDVLDQRLAALVLKGCAPRFRSTIALGAAAGRGIRNAQADSARAYLPAHRWSTNKYLTVGVGCR